MTSNQVESGNVSSATHILTFIVCGLVSILEFPYTSFPCVPVSG